MKKFKIFDSPQNIFVSHSTLRNPLPTLFLSYLGFEFYIMLSCSLL